MQEDKIVICSYGISRLNRREWIETESKAIYQGWLARISRLNRREWIETPPSPAPRWWARRYLPA